MGNFHVSNDEKVIWDGKPSQWVNFRPFLYCALMSIALIIVIFWIALGFKWWIFLFYLYPIGRALFAWLEVYSKDYKLTDKRLLYREGVFNRVTTETELSQIKEVTLIEPWYKRIVGLGDIRLSCLGIASPSVLIPGVRNADEVRELFNKTIKQYHSDKLLKTE